MKHPLWAFALLLIAIVVGVMAGGCSPTQITAAGGNVAAMNAAAAGALKVVAASIVAACPAGEAFATAAAAATANPGVVLAQDANGLFCAMNKAIVAVPLPAASAPTPASAP